MEVKDGEIYWLLARRAAMTKDRGSLTIEASLALTAFIFFIMMFLGFNTVYRVQGVVSHAALQASQSLAINSFMRETVGSGKTVKSIENIASFAEFFLGSDMTFDDGFESLGSDNINLSSQIKTQFVYAIASNEIDADNKLKKLGVKNGLQGISFSESKVENSKIYIRVKYTVELPYNFFGVKEVVLYKTTVSKAMKSIK